MRRVVRTYLGLSALRAPVSNVTDVKRTIAKHKERGRHFSDGETNRVGAVSVLVWQDNTANLIGVDT